MIDLLPFGSIPRVISHTFLRIAFLIFTVLALESSQMTPPLLRLKLVILVPATPIMRTHFMRSPVMVRGTSSKSSARALRPYEIPPGCVYTARTTGQRAVLGVVLPSRITVVVKVPVLLHVIKFPENVPPVAVTELIVM